MRTELGSLILAILLTAPLGAQGMPTSGMLPEGIVTSGEGEVRVTPDRAALVLGVQTRAATAATAASENARRQRAVIDTLKAIGIPANLITTTGYSVSPETRYDKSTGQTSVTGYVVNNSVRAELHRLTLLGPAIDGALARGANQVNSLEFTSSESNQARRAALAAAVTNAKADAEAIARAAGGTLGRLVEVTEPGGIRPMRFEATALSMAASPAPTPIEPGQATVRASVTTRWQFVPDK